MADVDVGVFLSSGIDSALLASYAVAAGAKPVAFTVGFSSYGDYDESRRAAETALHLGLEHHVEQFDMGFTEAVDLVTGAFDLPLADASAIATLVLARLARSSVTVALSGTEETSSSPATTGIGRIVCAGSSDACPHRCASRRPGWRLDAQRPGRAP